MHRHRLLELRQLDVRLSSGLNHHVHLIHVLIDCLEVRLQSVILFRLLVEGDLDLHLSGLFLLSFLLWLLEFYRVSLHLTICHR